MIISNNNLDIVSIIIPTYNRKDELRLCLKKIFLQNYKDLEIVVVDDASVDGTSLMIESDFPKVELLKNKKNVGPSQAKNQAVKHSHGKYVLFLDSDTEMLYPDTVSTMVKIMKDDEQIGELGGELVLDKETGLKQICGFNLLYLNLHTIPAYLETSENDKMKTMMECDFVATSNCMVRSELIEKIGGFDRYYRYTGEDKELGYKIKRLGYKNIIDFRVAVLHAYSKKSRASLSSYDYHRTRIRFFIKNSKVKNILILPIIELYFLFVYIRRLYKNKYYTQGGSRDDEVRIIKGIAWFIELFLAYVWNLVFLPQTIFIRLRNINFLKNE